LKQGAFVVESAADILAAVPRLAQFDADPAAGETDAGEESESGADGSDNRRRLLQRDTERLLAALGKTPTDPDALAEHTEMDAATVQRLLLHLEMAGRAERDSQGRYTAI
jgi:DNA processing protein